MIGLVSSYNYRIHHSSRNFSLHHVDHIMFLGLINVVRRASNKLASELRSCVPVWLYRPLRRPESGAKCAEPFVSKSFEVTRKFVSQLKRNVRVAELPPLLGLNDNSNTWQEDVDLAARALCSVYLVVSGAACGQRPPPQHGITAEERDDAIVRSEVLLSRW